MRPCNPTSKEERNGGKERLAEEREDGGSMCGQWQGTESEGNEQLDTLSNLHGNSMRVEKRSALKGERNRGGHVCLVVQL